MSDHHITNLALDDRSMLAKGHVTARTLRHMLLGKRDSQRSTARLGLGDRSVAGAIAGVRPSER